MYRKRWNPNCNGNRRDKVALKITCIKYVKFKIIKIRTGCQYVGYFDYKTQTGPHKTSTWPHAGPGLDIAGPNQRIYVEAPIGWSTCATARDQIRHSKECAFLWNGTVWIIHQAIVAVSRMQKVRQERENY